MEHIPEQAVPELLKYGAGGLIALLAILALSFVWTHSKNLAKELAASNASRADDAERRFQETKAIAEKVVDGLGNVSKTMAVLSAAFENTNRLNEDRLVALQTMAAQMGPFGKEIERIADKVDRGLEDLRDLKRERREQ